MKMAGKVIVTLFLAGFALCGQASAEEVADVNSAISQIQDLILEKLALIEAIDATVQDEQAVCDTLEQMLADKDYGSLTKNDVAKAQREMESVIRKQNRAKGLLEKCVSELRGTLSTLGWQPPTPVGHWALDDGSGNTAEDSAGTNDGTIYGEPNWVAGALGGALEFDGIDDYVDCGMDSSLMLQNNLSVAFWFKSDVTGGPYTYRGLVGTWKSSAPSESGYLVIHRNNGHVQVARPIGSNWHTMDSTYSLTDGDWHHVVAVYDTSGTYLYADGSLDRSNGIGGNMNMPSKVTIGSTITGTTCLNGSIDDARIYNVPLSAIETVLLYHNLLD